MAKCKITVLKCLFDQELKDEYIHDENYGPCPYFKPGDVVIYEGGPKPESFGCSVGWRSISEEAGHFTGQGGGPGGPPPEGVPEGPPPEGGPGGPMGVHIVCCNDGVRPVIFKLEPSND